MLTDYYKIFSLEEKIDAGFDGVAWSLAGIYKGFIQPIGGGETYRDGKAGEQATHRLYTYVATPAEYGQRVTQNGQAYIVLYAIQPDGISGVDHHKEIVLGVFE